MDRRPFAPRSALRRHTTDLAQSVQALARRTRKVMIGSAGGATQHGLRVAVVDGIVNESSGIRVRRRHRLLRTQWRHRCDPIIIMVLTMLLLTMRYGTHSSSKVSSGMGGARQPPHRHLQPTTSARPVSRRTRRGTSSASGAERTARPPAADAGVNAKEALRASSPSVRPPPRLAPRLLSVNCKKDEELHAPCARTPARSRSS